MDNFPKPNIIFRYHHNLKEMLQEMWRRLGLVIAEVDRLSPARLARLGNVNKRINHVSEYMKMAGDKYTRADLFFTEYREDRDRLERHRQGDTALYMESYEVDLAAGKMYAKAAEKFRIEAVFELNRLLADLNIELC